MKTTRPVAYPSAPTRALLDLLQIDLPVMQAPAGGVVSRELTAAVSESGGLGGIPLSWSSPDQAAATVAAVRELTGRPFFVNFVLHFGAGALDAALEAGAPVVQFSWGMPDQHMIRAIRDRQATLGVQVTSRDSARTAIDLGADYLVCQGTEAGGHVHASRSLSDALAEVVSVAGSTPVVASGGIANGHRMRDVLQLGAAGVVMGSRFVASTESAAHEQYKQALVDSSGADTVFTTCMNKGWDNATHRILRNSTHNMYEAAGSPAPGKRPGESDIIAKYTMDTDSGVERYSINSPGRYYEGNIEAMAAYAGAGIGDITEVLPAGEIVSRIWKEFVG